MGVLGTTWGPCPEAYVYSFALAFVFAPVVWNVAVFFVYIIIMELLFWVMTDTIWTPAERVGSLFFAFFGWMCGRLWIGDETPLRGVEGMHDDCDEKVFIDDRSLYKQSFSW